MPSPETSDLVHKALLWEFISNDRYGNSQVSAAVEIQCRWVPKRRTIVDAQGKLVATDVTVAVNREIPEHSIMWKGGFDDIPGTADVPDSGFMEVVAFDEADDVKGRETAREVRLMRYKNTLPEIV